MPIIKFLIRIMQVPLVDSTRISLNKSKPDDMEINASGLLMTAATTRAPNQSVSGYMEIPVSPDEEEGTPGPRLMSKSVLFIVAGFFFILFSIGGGGGIGVFTQFYTADSLILRNFWRYQVALAYLIPVISVELYFLPLKWRQLTMSDALILLILCPFCMIGWSTCIIFVSRVTLLLHAIVLNNLCGPFILAANLVFRLPVHRLEWQGCIVALVGAAAMMFDPAAEKADGSKASITGDLLALIGAVCGALLYFFQG